VSGANHELAWFSRGIGPGRLEARQCDAQYILRFPLLELGRRSAGGALGVHPFVQQGPLKDTAFAELPQRAALRGFQQPLHLRNGRQGSVRRPGLADIHV
jgi:hypothetical protein